MARAYCDRNMAITDGMRESSNIIDMRGTFAILPLLISPALLAAAAWVAPIGWRWRIAAWLVILALVVPAFLA